MRMRAFAILAIVLGVAGCDQLRGGGVAIVDLDAVARALGRDEAIERRVGSANEQLTSQLEEVASGLREELRARAQEVPRPETDEGRRQLARIQAEAQTKLEQTARRAQALSARYRQEVVAAFRKEVRPHAERVARERGLRAVFTASSATLWFDAEVDITDEVIASMREAGVGGSPAPGPEAPEGSDAGPSSSGSSSSGPSASVGAAPAGTSGEPAGDGQGGRPEG